MTVRRVPMAQLAAAMEVQFAAGGTAVLPVTGGSMLPMLRGGRDSVTLAPPVHSPVRGDVVLYRRGSGQYVLHRVVRLLPDGGLLCCGDNQWKTERVALTQVLAMVTSFHRKGLEHRCDTGGYRLYAGGWTALLPVRCPILFCRRLLGRIVRKARESRGIWKDEVEKSAVRHTGGGGPGRSGGGL